MTRISASKEVINDLIFGKLASTLSSGIPIGGSPLLKTPTFHVAMVSLVRVVAVMSVGELVLLISVVGATLAVGVEVSAKVMPTASISKRVRVEVKNGFIIYCLLVITNLANNEEKTTVKSKLFLFFLRTTKYTPFLVVKNIVKIICLFVKFVLHLH